jgi:hypothetical protein
MGDEPRERGANDDPLRYLEAVLASLVHGAAAWATTITDFLFRPRRFDAVLVRDPGAMGAGRPSYLRPLSFLLLNQVFYFWVYPRRERGPTHAVIEWMPAPILHSLDRIEHTLSDPNLGAILLVVGPLVLLAALHALMTTRLFRVGGVDVGFETLLRTTCYSVGTMLAMLGLSAVVGATLTDRAVGGDLGGTALAAYITLLVLPFVTVWARCIQRHFAMVHATTGASWPRTIGVVLGATLALGLLVAALLALVGLRASVDGVVDASGAS